ncbi:hypothetical protein CBR_g54935 [Chara braunii]|uniref:Uncharacterized protein n=1 Tax=Chara braunii TaxID=69332 RepID=A0A388K7E9_CHABU|nr:hypothetical protein CBR_g54935 [Chara braunii]|eukprot:GBG65956.1 hypothetical protein CBR_g54935 [Chara braunii]
MLGQYGSDGEVGGVSGDIEMASGVGDLEDRGRGDGLLDGDNMAEVFDVPSGKRTFAELGVEFLLSEDREDLAEVVKVGLEGGAKDKDVIKVDDDTDFEEVAEDVVHGRLEGSGGIGESEWHHEELVVPKPRAEGGLVSVLLADTDLVEATTKVDLSKVLGSMETIKELGNPRSHFRLKNDVCDDVANADCRIHQVTMTGRNYSSALIKQHCHEDGVAGKDAKGVEGWI